MRDPDRNHSAPVATEDHPTNHLAGETSPYLRQHLHNPVDWYPWGPEAFTKAQREDKPIFLSIGYSACHWCHVMAHESFEDPDIARYLNEHFVSIKVDREERPDLDQQFQTVAQVTGRNGGWPLSIFLTPAGVPFFAGTYFPPRARYGMIGFPGLLRKIFGLFRERRGDLDESGRQITGFIERVMVHQPATGPGKGELTPVILDSAVDLLEARFEPQYGGLGVAPKFPHFSVLLFLIRELREAEITPQMNEGGMPAREPLPARLRDLVETTLDNMAAGGIYDHVGGGFHRYSVDDQWLVPHFEKMLYDNALALVTYAEAYQYYRKPRYKQVVREIATWALEEMFLPGKGFYATLDADSEGEEGKYYTWTTAEIKTLLADDEYRLFAKAYGVTPEGNFEGGRTILAREFSDAELARIVNAPPAEIRKTLRGAREGLLRARRERVPPHRDEKILTSWNGLMAHGLLVATRVLDNSDLNLLTRARDVLAFLRAQLYDPATGRLLHVYAGGQAKIPGNLDDYAYLTQALWTEFEVTHARETLEWIRALLATTRAEFEDGEKGGFFYASAQQKDLLVRGKSGVDAPLPSPNAVMAENLVQAYLFTDDEAALEGAERTLALFAGAVRNNPVGYGAMLLTLQWYLYGSTEITIVDPALDAETRRLPTEFARWYLPRLHFYHGPGGSPDVHGEGDQEEGEGGLPAELAFLAGRSSHEGQRAWYLCLRRHCYPPFHDKQDFVAFAATLFQN